MNTVLLLSLINVTNFQIAGSNLQTLLIPSLTSGGLFYIQNTSLATLNTPLVSANRILMKGNNLVQSINFGNLVSASAIDFSFNPNLTAIDLSSLSTLANSSINFSNFTNNKLPSTQINAILNKLLSVSPSVPKTVIMDHQNPLAPPTGQGVIDKATLISQGNYNSY